jgi:hypothetical protein
LPYIRLPSEIDYLATTILYTTLNPNSLVIIQQQLQ